MGGGGARIRRLDEDPKPSKPWQISTREDWEEKVTARIRMDQDRAVGSPGEASALGHEMAMQDREAADMGYRRHPHALLITEEKVDE